MNTRTGYLGGTPINFTFTQAQAQHDHKLSADVYTRRTILSKK